MEHNPHWTLDTLHLVTNKDAGVWMESDEARSSENVDSTFQAREDSDQTQSQGEGNMGKENPLTTES